MQNIWLQNAQVKQLMQEIDMIAMDQSPNDISDRIKQILMQKSAENIDLIRPIVASTMFGQGSDEE